MVVAVQLGLIRVAMASALHCQKGGEDAAVECERCRLGLLTRDSPDEQLLPSSPTQTKTNAYTNSQYALP